MLCAELHSDFNIQHFLAHPKNPPSHQRWALAQVPHFELINDEAPLKVRYYNSFQ
jgi:hypothetical protein